MKNTFKLTILILIISVYASCVKNTDGSVTVVPLAPTNLTASVLSSVKVSLQWTDNATNETGYKIERKIATGNYAVVGTVLADITNFKDSSLSPNTTYTYRVYPYNAAGNSITYSNEVTVTTSNSSGGGGSNNAVFDPNNYFKITFLGKTLTNQGITYMNQNWGYVCHLLTRSASSGSYTDLTMSLDGSMQNMLLGSAPYNQPETQELIVDIMGTKQGYALGYYSSKLNNGSYIKVLKNNKSYNIDTTGFNLNITTADIQYVVGTLSCQLIDGSTKIPANAVFKLSRL